MIQTTRHRQRRHDAEPRREANPHKDGERVGVLVAHASHGHAADFAERTTRVCDTGHEVVFHKNSGFNRHIKTGKTFEFKRVAGVYRMEVDIDEAQVFSGPE